MMAYSSFHFNAIGTDTQNSALDCFCEKTEYPNTTRELLPPSSSSLERSPNPTLNAVANKTRDINRNFNRVYPLLMCQTLFKPFESPVRVLRTVRLISAASETPSIQASTTLRCAVSPGVQGNVRLQFQPAISRRVLR